MGVDLISYENLTELKKIGFTLRKRAKDEMHVPSFDRVFKWFNTKGYDLEIRISINKTWYYIIQEGNHSFESMEYTDLSPTKEDCLKKLITLLSNKINKKTTKKK